MNLFTKAVCSSWLSDKELADGLGVGVPTVRRWRSGRVVPHRGVRRVVYDFIREHSQNENFLADVAASLAIEDSVRVFRLFAEMVEDL